MDFAQTMTMLTNIMRGKPRMAMAEVQAQLDRNEAEIQANEALIASLKEKQQQIELVGTDADLDALEAEMKSGIC